MASGNDTPLPGIPGKGATAMSLFSPSTPARTFWTAGRRNPFSTFTPPPHRRPGAAGYVVRGSFDLHADGSLYFDNGPSSRLIDTDVQAIAQNNATSVFDLRTSGGLLLKTPTGRLPKCSVRRA